MSSNIYTKQFERGLKRKIELVKFKGGKCELCGYSNNLSALEFHHIVPLEKSFPLDARHLSNTSVVKLVEESKKCRLLCSNCHRELHHPEYEKDNLQYLLEQCLSDKEISLCQKMSFSKCKFCGKEFKAVNGKIFCSEQCRYNNKNYPSVNELKQKYSKLRSWEKVAEYFGITRKIVQNIRKRAIE